MRVMKVLPQRLGKFGLTLHPEKTKLIELGEEKGQQSSTFDFLGFTHYMSKSRKGKHILKRKTSSKKLRASLKRMEEWIMMNRHGLIGGLIAELNRKLRGHYAYYGITFNGRKLSSYYEQTKRMLHKWVNRRGGKRVWNWEQFSKLTKEWIPLLKPKIYHSYQQAKP